MKHGKLPKNPSAQFKAFIMDFHVSYEKSAPLKSKLHVIQKTYKKLNLVPFTFLEISVLPAFSVFSPVAVVTKYHF